VVEASVFRFENPYEAVEALNPLDPDLCGVMYLGMGLGGFDDEASASYVFVSCCDFLAVDNFLILTFLLLLPSKFLSEFLVLDKLFLCDIYYSYCTPSLF
jgi:hypothetical protein